MNASLRSFYFLRAGVAYAWVIAAATTHLGQSAFAAIALALYATWDAIANGIDIRRNPLPGDRTRQLNVVASLVAAAAMAAGAVIGFNIAVIAFGLWAFVAGVFQLIVGLRRRTSTNGQILMILSGAQSALAGVFFTRLGIVATPAITDLIGYAGFGASYFLASALWLTWKGRQPSEGSRARA